MAATEESDDLTTSQTKTKSNSNSPSKSKRKSKKKSKDSKHKKHKKVNKRLLREMREILLDPPEGCAGGPKSMDNINLWIATINGPQGSPYENGRFYFEIKFPKQYPFEPPKVLCKTKIYHCNFNKQGEICLDILKDQWSAALTISKILLSISALLDDPNPEDPLDGEIANMYKQSKIGHDEIAREWTRRYAEPINKNENNDVKNKNNNNKKKKNKNKSNDNNNNSNNCSNSSNSDNNDNKMNNDKNKENKETSVDNDENTQDNNNNNNNNSDNNNTTDDKMDIEE